MMPLLNFTNDSVQREMLEEADNPKAEKSKARRTNRLIGHG